MCWFTGRIAHLHTMLLKLKFTTKLSKFYMQGAEDLGKMDDKQRFDSKPMLQHDCFCHKRAQRAINALQGCSNAHMRTNVTLTSRAVTLNGQDACPICWEALTCGPAIMLICGHACHLACAKEHLKQVSATCFQRHN